MWNSCILTPSLKFLDPLDSTRSIHYNAGVGKFSSVANPGFPRGGGANRKGAGADLLMWPIVPQNCIKIKR